MKSVFDFAAVPANNDKAPKACPLAGTERTLDCGSIVIERGGRIVSKTAFLPSA